LEELTEKNIEIKRLEDVINLFGNHDENIKIIEDGFDVKINCRDKEIRVAGEKPRVDAALVVIGKLLNISGQGERITKQNVLYLTNLARENNLDVTSDYLNDVICYTAKGRKIRAKTSGQKAYVREMKDKDIVFAIGPAGTGKTYLAVTMAVLAFKNKDVNRIILTRPAVEAGEKLGFLPGDMQNKVDPYLRPLYDSLYEIMGAETYQNHLEKGSIEVAPLAYMRGRTLDDSFVILDEAQNTTPEQMKMFLTRIGVGSRAVINGDITQIDLPEEKKSGLKEAVRILSDVEGIGFVYLTDKDVVRHELVQRIIRAYERHSGKK
jgi:phosphate starvation-inducible PhoH-like protein